MNPILLDTHVAVWAASGMLSGNVVKIIDGAALRNELLLSPISAWEIGMLVHKKRLTLATTVQDYVRALFGRPGVVTAVLTPTIGAAAAVLPASFHADPADRLLVATARAYGAQLVTRDKRIHDYAKSSKALRCLIC